MLEVHPQYIEDAEGNKSMVVLRADEYHALLEELEDAEDVRLYDQAKQNDDGERIPMTEAFRIIEEARKNKL